MSASAGGPPGARVSSVAAMRQRLSPARTTCMRSPAERVGADTGVGRRGCAGIGAVGAVVGVVVGTVVGGVVEGGVVVVVEAGGVRTTGTSGAGSDSFACGAGS